jgi:hypothetical protein
MEEKIFLPSLSSFLFLFCVRGGIGILDGCSFILGQSALAVLHLTEWERLAG